jgi:hypothetical protein
MFNPHLFGAAYRKSYPGHLMIHTVDKPGECHSQSGKVNVNVLWIPVDNEGFVTLPKEVE